MRIEGSAHFAVHAARKLARRGACLLFLLLLAACVGEEREQSLGDSIATELNQELPLIRDPLLGSYVGRLGTRLASVSQRPNVPYRFYIVNSDAINAFALPGGHIYVTRGLIEQTESVSQLAAVLAHEVGHVAARHGAEQLERHIRTGSLVSFLYQTVFGREPALLEQQALRFGNRIWSARHSREDEREADRLAVRYLLDSGVDPHGILKLLQQMRDAEPDPSGFAAEWFSTHPLTADRITALQKEIDQRWDDAPPTLMQDVASYPAFLRRLKALSRPPRPH